MCDQMEIGPENEVDCDYAVEFLTNMAEDDDLRDIKLVAGIDNQKFSVHRLVLMTSSKYFRTLFGPHFKDGVEKEVTIGEIDGPTLKSIIDFCYTGKIQINDENIKRIVSAASLMELVSIEEKCENIWSKKLTAFNCVDIFSSADKYNFSNLRDESLDFICKHFEAVPTDQLQEVKFQWFSELLKSDRVHALEEIIFQRLIQWVGFDAEARSKYVPELLESIYLEKISGPVLMDFVEPFATKYNCSDVVTNEYRRRMACDMISEPYRYTPTPSKSLFVSSFDKNMFVIQKYNSISDRWSWFGSINANQIMKRSNFGLVFAENKLLIIGGYDVEGYPHTVIECDLDLDSLEPVEKNKIETGRRLVDPIFFDNQIFIFGGLSNGALSACESFSLATMTTKTLQPLRNARYYYSSAIMSGKIYVAGGKVDRKTWLNSVECYNHLEDKWTEVANMNFPRARFALVEASGMLYAMGYHTPVERYDPAQNVWTVIGSFRDSGNIYRAINLRDEIYVLMSDGKFGKFKAKPECSLHYLHAEFARASTRRFLFLK